MPPRCAPTPCTSRPGGRCGCGDLWKRGERRGHSPGRPSPLSPAPASEPAPRDATGRRAGSRLGYQPCRGWGPWDLLVAGDSCPPQISPPPPSPGTPGSHPSKVPLSSRTLAFCLAEIREGGDCCLCVHCSSSMLLITIASIRWIDGFLFFFFF